MQTQDRKLFSPNNACDALDISRTKLYALMKAGRIKWVYVGADRRIPAEEIDRISREGVSNKAA